MSEKRKNVSAQVKPPQIPDDLSVEGLSGGLLRDHALYDYVSLSHADLSGQTALDVSFEAARLSHVSMTGGSLPGLRLLDVRLEDCDLANVDLYKASLQRVEVVASRIVGLKASDAEFRDVLFKECKGELVLFRHARFKSVRFDGCDLADADFEGSDLSGVIFSRCNLTRCLMAGAKLEGADFRGSNIEGWKVGLDDLRGAVFSPVQAMEFVGLLGLVLKADEE